MKTAKLIVFMCIMAMPTLLFAEPKLVKGTYYEHAREYTTAYSPSMWHSIFVATCPICNYANIKDIDVDNNRPDRDVSTLCKHYVNKAFCFTFDYVETEINDMKVKELENKIKVLENKLKGIKKGND